MSVQTQFSRYADHYGTYNIIQQQVIEKLIDDLDGKQPMRIVDLGCGSGGLYNALQWDPDYFLGIDFAEGMVALHPRSNTVACTQGDFNDPALFTMLGSQQLERVFSASALQWSQDLSGVLHGIKALNVPVSLAIFSGNTFSTLFKTANVPPLLLDSQTIQQMLEEIFHKKAEVVQYRLAFDSVREMLRYMKRSGVSGSRNILSYKATRDLINNYPLDYLEFEVIFLTT